MLDFPRWKVIWLWALTLVCVVAALPSLTSVAGLPWPAALPSPKINLGLDLAGGSHILLEADARQVGRQRLETMEETVRQRFRQAEPRIQIGEISNRNGALSFVVADPAQVNAARDQVVTAGGLIGKVLRVDEQYVDLELAPNVKVKAVKSTIGDIVPPGSSQPAND